MFIRASKLVVVLAAGMALAPCAAWADRYRCDDGSIITGGDCPDGGISHIIPEEVTRYQPPAPVAQPAVPAQPAVTAAPAPVAAAPVAAPESPKPHAKPNFVGTWKLSGYNPYGPGGFGQTIFYGAMTINKNNTYAFRGGKGAYRIEGEKLKFTSGPLAPNTVEVVSGECCEMIWQGKDYPNWNVSRAE